MMKCTTFLLLALSLAAVAASAQEFSVYKWVDKDGVPQYTDRPPTAADATPTGIRSRRTNPEAVMARTEQAAERNSLQSENREKAGEQSAEDAAQRAQTREERKANCQRAREKAETYNTAQRLYRPMPGGGREYLTDQELSDARNAADQDISTWCD
jgi:Skp family chaperone for outer membrane proteins